MLEKSERIGRSRKSSTYEEEKIIFAFKINKHRGKKNVMLQFDDD